MGLAGYKERPISDDDPLVCGCGVTLGTQVLAKLPERLAEVQAAHAPEHRRRMAHQARHRGYEAPAEDKDADS